MEKQTVFNIDAFAEEVLIWMEFEKIHSVMQHLNWCWKFSDTPPTIQEIKQSCAKEIRRAYKSFMDSDHLNLSTGTGGWDVYLFRESFDNKDIGISVKFVVSEWNNYL